MGQMETEVTTQAKEGRTLDPGGRLKAKLRGVLNIVLRNASYIALVSYLAGSLGGLLALTSAGRPGGLDEKSFQLSVASPQLGATKAADILRLYHIRKNLTSTSILEDTQAMWNDCETRWQPSAGRRHELAWYLGGGNVVYDVVEATRSDGTESLLVVIPYSPGLDSSSLGMAVGHGLGWYLQEKEWLAKNVVIAYVAVTKFSSELGLENSLDTFLSNTLDRRIGRIVQAVILDFVSTGSETVPIAQIKVHGWNGRLPNMDLFIAARQLAETHFASRERITVHGASTQKDLTWNKGRALMRFVAHHGLGIADGGHGILLDRGVDALTVQLSFKASNANLFGVLQMLEGLVRGLNNLHEGLHHATGLYALGGAGVVIDIGMYTACPVLLALACALKAYQLTSAEHGPWTTYVTWNQAVRWTTGLLCGVASLYTSSHALARHPTSGRTLPSMDALKSCAVAFGRIAILAVIITEFFVVRGDEMSRNELEGGNTVRWDATVAWALCSVSVILILYRWSLAWMALTAFLPLILT